MNIVSAVTPVGSQILVELLTGQEMTSSVIQISDETKSPETPQAYVLALGNKVPEDFAAKVGDRVVLIGNYVPMPKSTWKSDREVACIEPHAIKAVLTEESVE